MLNFSPFVQLWFNTVLIWIGFGTVAGLTARALLPKGKPDGLYGALVIGVCGSCAGIYLVDMITKHVNIDEFSDINPIGPVGLVASVIVSFVIILFYRFVLLIKSLCTKRPINSSSSKSQTQARPQVQIQPQALQSQTQQSQTTPPIKL
jgi:uncharacterized membrane protein YeaQ/YmgE (transglycosylase-associated protein family)